MSEYIIRNYGSIVDASLIGQYLVSSDVDARDGRGEAEWTHDHTKAMKFSSSFDAMKYWMRQSTVRPLRPDGKCNRPLTAYTIEPVALDDDGQPKTESLL